MADFANGWVDEYGDLLYRFAITRVNDKIVAEDLVQDTFISALKGYGDFQKRSSEKSWIVSILKHKIIDHYRAKRRYQVDSYDELDTVGHLFNSAGKWKKQVCEWHKTPEEALQDDEFKRVLEKCIRNLPQKHREVFSFVDVDGLSGDDVCEILSLSSSNLWVITYRARQAMRNCLTHNWFGGKV